MKYYLFCLLFLFVVPVFKTAAQSDAAMAEFSSNYSKIVGYPISDEEKFKQIKQYVPDAFFQKKGFAALSAAIGTRSVTFINYILAKPGVNAAELGASKESILSYLPWDNYKIVKAGTCVQIDTIANFRKNLALLLMSKGASISQQDISGNHIISRAVYNKDLDFIQFIFEKNGNKLVKTPELLYSACSVGCVDVVAWLLDHGLDVNEPNNYEGSAVGSSVTKPALVSYLINKGANVNQANKAGWTPLMYAVNQGNTETVQLLIAAGADLKATNNKGWNALQVAKEYKRKDLVKMLNKIMEGK